MTSLREFIAQPFIPLYGNLSHLRKIYGGKWGPSRRKAARAAQNKGDFYPRGKIEHKVLLIIVFHKSRTTRKMRTISRKVGRGGKSGPRSDQISLFGNTISHADPSHPSEVNASLPCTAPILCESARQTVSRPSVHREEVSLATRRPTETPQQVHRRCLDWTNPVPHTRGNCLCARRRAQAGATSTTRP